MEAEATRAGDDVDRRFLVGLARAAAGALLFALPLLMTMEMWWLGFYMDRWRLVLLLVLQLPLLVGLSYFSGFEETFDLRDDALDACAALAVAYVVSAVVLALFGVLRPGMPADELLGKLGLQAVPAAMGALLAQSQLAGGEDDARGPRGGAPPGYWGELFLMAVGALFLAFNLAPTEEMILIGYRMTPVQVLALALLSLAIMHAFVYAVEFRGHERTHSRRAAASAFLRFTVVGYAIVLLVSAYVLWTFGRFDGAGAQAALVAAVVLSLPGAIGAAAARLVL